MHTALQNNSPGEVLVESTALETQCEQGQSEDTLRLTSFSNQLSTLDGFCIS